LEKFDGKYWLSYIGGALKGYETDPLAIGIAWTTDPSRPIQWNRLARPVLSRDQADVREFEDLTQYKSNIIYDRQRSLGYPFVMFYFGAFRKPKAFDTFACSYDLVHWTKWQGPDLVFLQSHTTALMHISLGSLNIKVSFIIFTAPSATRDGSSR
jgi:hypothetical protein